MWEMFSDIVGERKPIDRAPLDLLFVNRKGFISDMMTGACLGHRI